jgi:NADH-quinone oxidoreductase subunit C
MRLENLQSTQLKKHLKPYLLADQDGSDGSTFSLTKAGLLKAAMLLKDELEFEQLLDVCGVDYLGRPGPRFEVVYHFLNLNKNQRVRLKVHLHEGEKIVSLVPLYPSANWWERETYDMYGIEFEGHPDLRRILTDYNFEGFPLRKDFPLTGHYEVIWDSEKREVVRTDVHLPQAYRTFDTVSPWTGVGDLFAKK